MTAAGPRGMLLDPGLDLTLRPMRYPHFYERFRDAIKNTWTVEEVDFATDVSDLAKKMTDAERHLVQRLIAFFATGDPDAMKRGAESAWGTALTANRIRPWR